MKISIKRILAGAGITLFVTQILYPRTAMALPVESDVVVYGGTPGGITAAISAAREGASVVLLEQTRSAVSVCTLTKTTTSVSPTQWKCHD